MVSCKMAFLGDGGGERVEETMRDESLHLYSFKLVFLRRGKERGPRRNLSAAGDHTAKRDSEFCTRESSDRKKESLKVLPSLPSEVGPPLGKHRVGGDGIEATMKSLMSDLQAATDRMTNAILRERLVEKHSSAAAPRSPSPSPPQAESLTPWNLRSRRAKAPTNGVNGGGLAKSSSVDVLKPHVSPLRKENVASVRKKRERLRLSVSLSRLEIEEDFMAMVGQRPPRRPQKRPKLVQRQLDRLFPGLLLTEVKADLYKVPDATKNGKRW